MTFCLLGGLSICRGEDGKKTEESVSAEEIVATLGAPAPPPNRSGRLTVVEAPRVTTKLHFKTDSTEFADEYSKAQLNALGKALTDPKLASYSFIIEGHSDSRGTAEHNLKLSKLRANAVLGMLVEKFGIDPQRLQARGKGEFEMLNKGETAEAHAENRRVVFIRSN